jgi:penicillin amidase
MNQVSESHESVTAAAEKSRRWSWSRRFFAVAGGVAVVGCVFLAVGLWKLRASLPILDGRQPLEGLAAAVTVERDARGVPTLRAENRLDVARGLGFVHAQDRFFQMDLLRRQSAGELSALVGAAAVGLDRQLRLHRFRYRANGVVERLPAEDRQLLEAYTAGVNAGLSALAVVPPEYLALRVSPQPWLPADTILTVYSMFLDLQNETGGHESVRGLMHDLLPLDLVAFLLPSGSPLDAPLEGPPLESADLPTRQVVDLRSQPVRDLLVSESVVAQPGYWDRFLDRHTPPEVVYGSNNWAVAGSHTADGHALLAGDMHLRLGVPSIWYRAAMHWPSVEGDRRVVGVTLPGTPCVVAGSTGKIAWAFTNSEGDWLDLVLLETDPADADRYLTPDGWKTFSHHQETIEVAGGEPVLLEVRETIWGPVVDRDHAGRLRVVRWTAHDPEGANLNLVRFEEIETVDEALALAGEVGVPCQNLVCVDQEGRVGWTIIGRIPKRVGFDGRRPTSWADGTARWDGWLPADERPTVVDPQTGRLWSANARVVPASGHGVIGDEGQDVGGRQGQIRDALLAIDSATPADMLAVQLDDRAVFLTRWRELLLDTLSADAVAGDQQRREARRLVEDWGGKASVESAGYRIVREWRLEVAAAALRPLVVEIEFADPRADYLRDFRRFETPLWTLLKEQPPHLLAPQFENWDDLLLSALDATLADLADDGPLSGRTWGEWNVSRVQHPLGAAIPLLADWLDMSPRPLPGDANMPRVQLPWAGASQRMVVSPGREDEGFFHMPGGQCGHFLSPHYRDGHEAWAKGQATPFLPGPPVHTLELVPTPSVTGNDTSEQG